ncbi:hypothetical protein GWI33_008245 [Rhynchophorus ferrugineus]|uniref:Microsomal glutathione S-transferase 1 n=1 Tax=Rhynchophorus ferrugineus TaxID=354439 RepID=A0A834IGE3_RHYFE|nr:hypothetical protein GWI33_008245 [Rhynchophorus ferrugineus]
MWWLTILTIIKRFKHKVVLNDEDAKTANATVGSHPAVERVRRAFQNDLENIPAFLFIGLVYLFVPAPNWLIHLLYYTYLLARIGHSIVYAVYILPQPSRGICFGLSFIIVLYMSLHVLIVGFIDYGKRHKM